MIHTDGDRWHMDINQLARAFHAAPGPVVKIRMNVRELEGYRRAIPDGCTDFACGRGPDIVHRAKGGEAAHGLKFCGVPIEQGAVTEVRFLTQADLDAEEAAKAAAADAPELVVADAPDAPPAA